MRNFFSKELFLLIVLCVLTRTPQIFGDHFLMDGDECVEGLMAKHLYEGRALPVYFYGQSYGFSLLEEVIIAINYTFCGISDFTVKLSMLLLWTIGILFFYKTLLQYAGTNKYLPLLVTLIFIFDPSWAAWSMKARGGYLSAFVLSSIFLYLLLNWNWKKDILRSTLLGAMLALIYQCQPLWVPGLVPIILFGFFKEGKRKELLILGIAMILTLGIFYLFNSNKSPDFWKPVIFDNGHDWQVRLMGIPRFIIRNFEGCYYLNTSFDAHFTAQLFAVSMFAFLVASIVFALVSWIRKRPDKWLLVLSGSVLFTLFYLLFLKDYAPRYLLPLTMYCLLLLFFVISKVRLKFIQSLILLFFIVIGCSSLPGFKNYAFYIPADPAHGDKENLEKMISYLKKNKVKYVFTNNGQLQWQLMFYSKEKIKCRFRNEKDRFQPYVDKVNDAFNSQKKLIAFISDEPLPAVLTASDVYFVGSSYFIYLNPDRALLEGNGFRF